MVETGSVFRAANPVTNSRYMNPIAKRERKRTNYFNPETTCPKPTNALARRGRASYLPGRRMEPLIRLIREYQRCKEATVRENLAVEFVCEVGPNLLRYARSRCGKEDAEDAYQETLAAIVAGLQNVEAGSDSQIWGWLYDIARKKVCNLFRGRKMRLATIVDTSLLKESLQAVHDNSPMTAGQRAELQEAVDLLKASSPPCLNYLWDRYVVGLTFVQLGEEYEVTEEAARKRVERCLKLAQDLIGK